ncbi:MAG: four helix bundle protein [Bacteroidetes bacterium]|nr:four helix bundle protein [Bacteroidota bacterium]MCL5737316.1 four helix bundle protein [Bacteroidota bacterium]
MAASRTSEKTESFKSQTPSSKPPAANSKHETLNSKQIQNTNDLSTRKFDLEDRTFLFSKRVLEFVNAVPKDFANNEIIKQVVRSAGSIGANYIEANESLSKKDFIMRAKISRKEAKEARYWLRLIKCSSAQEEERNALIQEATELMKIFGAIITKSTKE